MRIRIGKRQIKWTKAASIALFVLGLETVNGQSQPPAGSIVLTNWISMNSSAVVHGNIFITNSTGSDLHNAFVFGNLEYSGPVIRNTANVQGTISTPFNAPINPISNPVWFDGTFVQYAGGGNPPANGTFLANGTSDYPTRIKVVGDFTVPGGKRFSILSDPAIQGYLTVWVTGKFTTSGSGRLNQDPTAHVTWIVDKDVNTSGDTYKNLSGSAANVSLTAVGTGKMNLTGSTTFIGTIDAPGRNVSISGSGGLSGAVIGNTLTLGSGSAVHCDEALPAAP